MSFSKLARVGYGYQKSAKTPKSGKTKKPNIIRDMTNQIFNERIPTVMEESDESFGDCS